LGSNRGFDHALDYEPRQTNKCDLRSGGYPQMSEHIMCVDIYL
jgi:hypothetical protein